MKRTIKARVDYSTRKTVFRNNIISGTVFGILLTPIIGIICVLSADGVHYSDEIKNALRKKGGLLGIGFSTICWCLVFGFIFTILFSNYLRIIGVIMSIVGFIIGVINTIYCVKINKKIFEKTDIEK